MPSLSQERIADLLRPYAAEAAVAPLLQPLSQYLDLLLRWNSRTNLTAVRDPEEIVQRHLGECLFAAGQIADLESALDFGSGAGLPGIPLQLVHPQAAVTLAESQGKKAAFLREAVRTLQLPAHVWSQRVELLPATERFGVVTMRAVDHSESMLPFAAGRVKAGGRMMLFLAGEAELPVMAEFELEKRVPIPGSSGTVAVLAHVPRGTQD